MPAPDEDDSALAQAEELGTQFHLKVENEENLEGISFSPKETVKSEIDVEGLQLEHFTSNEGDVGSDQVIIEGLMISPGDNLLQQTSSGEYIVNTNQEDMSGDAVKTQFHNIEFSDMLNQQSDMMEQDTDETILIKKDVESEMVIGNIEDVENVMTEDDVGVEQVLFDPNNPEHVQQVAMTDQGMESTTEMIDVNLTQTHEDVMEGIEETISSELSELVTEQVTTLPAQFFTKSGRVVEVTNPTTHFKKIYPAIASNKSSLKRPFIVNTGGQQKNVITRVIIQGNNPNQLNQSYKLIGNTGLVQTQPKTLTFAQAQQMGLIQAGTKIQQIVPDKNKRMIVKKIVPATSGLLSPTKILPAQQLSPVRSGVKPVLPAVSKSSFTAIRTVSVSPLKQTSPISGVTQIRPVPVSLSAVKSPVTSFVNIKPNTAKTQPQKVIIRQSPVSLKGATVISNQAVPGQVLRIPQQALQFKGKQLQYVKILNTTNVGSNIVTTNSKGKIIKTAVNLPSTFKAIPIAPNPGTSLKTVLPKTAVGNQKRILIPMSQGMSQIRTVTSNDSSLKTVTSPVSVSAIQLKNVSLSTQIQEAIKLGLKPSTDDLTVETLDPKSDEDDDEEDGDNIEEKDEHQVETLKDDDCFDKENIENDGPESSSPNQLVDALEANGMRMKKPCNCTRSQCLKLYCECFANGEFCYQCNCINCYNNLEHEEERQKSIKSCLERNPAAFRPKIQIGESDEEERRHNKGCHCKRSGCLKNYCECYEARIVCSKYCKCAGCRNTEEFLEGGRSGLIDLADIAEESFHSEKGETPVRVTHFSNSIPKQPYNFMSSEVIEATCQCLMAQAEEALKNDLTRADGEKMIIEEFGRCLVQIIGCTNNEERH